jgi:CTD small phosphatase-like protein 2
LIVFTASHECYANVIIDYIDQKRLISHRFFRDSCWRSEEGFYVKDLRVIDRDLKNVLLIDNVSIIIYRLPTAIAST